MVFDPFSTGEGSCYLCLCVCVCVCVCVLPVLCFFYYRCMVFSELKGGFNVFFCSFYRFRVVLPVTCSLWSGGSRAGLFLPYLWFFYYRYMEFDD